MSEREDYKQFLMNEKMAAKFMLHVGWMTRQILFNKLWLISVKKYSDVEYIIWSNVWFSV